MAKKDLLMSKIIEHNNTVHNSISSIQEHLSVLDNTIHSLEVNVGSLNQNIRPIAVQECENLLNRYNNTFDSMLATTNNTLSTASSAVSHIDSMIGWYLAISAILLSIVSLAFQYLISKDRKDKIKDAVAEVLRSVSTDESLKKEVIKNITENEDFRNEFNAIIEDKVQKELTSTLTMEEAGQGLDEIINSITVDDIN